MIKKLLFLFVVFALSNSVVGQNLNEYKYALVPSKFSFLKEDNKYQLNTLAKLFMEKYGFETYMESESAPDEFLTNNCNKVYVDVEKFSTMFVTKLKVVLKDCRGNVLFTSKQGTSKHKEYRVAYNEALRDAFTSFATLNHKYDASKATVKQTENTVNNAAVEQPKTVTIENNSTTPNTLFAQPIQNGFQLVNTEPRVIMKLYKTSVKDFYTAVKGDIQGALVLKNSEWFFEYYKNDQLVSEKVEVKF
ncbi:MAG: hypothetical protein V4648_05640 [Bacteroidota bacterium]